jgi:hypothetical protein
VVRVCVSVDKVIVCILACCCNYTIDAPPPPLQLASFRFNQLHKTESIDEFVKNSPPPRPPPLKSEIHCLLTRAQHWFQSCVTGIYFLLPMFLFVKSILIFSSRTLYLDVRYSDQKFAATARPAYACYIPRPLSVPWIDYPNTSRWRIQICEAPHCAVFSAFCHVSSQVQVF